MQKPNLILTGATGLVGSRFVELYRDQFEISNLDLATGVDITSAEQVEAFISSHPATTLIHLAAFTDTARAESEVGDKEGVCYRVNVIGTENIAQSCKNHNIFMIHVSTDFVFDGTKKAPYVESDPRSPISWYGTTKALAEEVVEQSGVKFAIARISYPYRANFEPKPDIIKKTLNALLSHTLTPRFSDTLITPTFVDDIAHGFAVLATTQNPGIYHLVGSTSLSPYELSRAVARAYEQDPSQVIASSAATYQKEHGGSYMVNGAMSNKATVEQLGIKMVDLKTGLETIKAQQK